MPPYHQSLSIFFVCISSLKTYTYAFQTVRRTSVQVCIGSLLGLYEHCQHDCPIFSTTPRLATIESRAEAIALRV